ncbi:MAG: hypothetical protein GY772_27205 [bacterium]|nr:hypothetical protein [bacterium]
MLTVANGIFDAAGLPSLSTDRAVAAVRSAARAAAPAHRRVHVAFPYLPFLRRVAAALPPLRTGSPPLALRQRAATLLLASTLMRPSDAAMLVFPRVDDFSDTFVRLFVCFGKGQKLRRASQGKILSDPFTFQCSGLESCPHCALRQYCEATRHLLRPAPPVAAEAPPLPDGAPPLRLLFMAHGSASTPAGVSANSLSSTVARLVKESGVPGATAYSLRGLVASCARSFGVSLDEVLWWGGWNAQTFHSHYNVASPQLPRLPPDAPPVTLFSFPRVVWRLALGHSLCDAS